MIPILRRSLLDAMCALGLFSASCPAQTTLPVSKFPLATLQVSDDKTSGIYAVNEPIRWRIEYSGKPPLTKVHFELKRGDLTLMQSGDLPLSGSAAVLETKLDTPGTVIAHFTAQGAKDALGKPLEALGGAVVAPEQITPSAPPPADFDEFWQSKVAQAAKVPLNPVLEKAPSERLHVSYWKVTLNNIGGTHVQGQVARPDNGKKFPAVLQLQYAGVYPLKKVWATDYAHRGWLALDIEAHDIPIDQSPAFYQKLAATRLNNYPNIGNDDRDKSYFLRMFLGCCQAARYLKERPDWDGKTLVITGGSQGGMQTLFTAAMTLQVTAAMCCVPAGCDLKGSQVGRAPGWPRWYFATAGKDAAKVIAAGQYYDAVNFAREIRCPLLLGVGLRDETVPAAGAIAAFNQAQGPKFLLVMPTSDHHGSNNTQAAYWAMSAAWLDAIKTGQPLPMQSAPPTTSK